MTTIRELWEDAQKVGDEDFEIVIAEEADFVYTSKVEFDLAREEARLS